MFVAGSQAITDICPDCEQSLNLLRFDSVKKRLEIQVSDKACRNRECVWVLQPSDYSEYLY